MTQQQREEVVKFIMTHGVNGIAFSLHLHNQNPWFRYTYDILGKGYNMQLKLEALEEIQRGA